MLKTTGLSGSALSLLDAEDEVVEGGGRADEKAKNLSKSKKLKNDKSEILTCTNIGATGEIFLTPNNRKAFNQLTQAFTKALIFEYFDPECHI